jgi:hypothetical protein
MSQIVQEVDLLDLVKYASKKNKKLQAVLLQKLEEYFQKDSVEYLELRKVILDETSGAFRAIIREIFGDVEYLV